MGGAGVAVVLPEGEVGESIVRAYNREGVYSVVYQRRKKGGQEVPARACSYRTLVAKPDSLRHKILHYDNPDRDLWVQKYAPATLSRYSVPRRGCVHVF
eukprot:590297-Rhodomonas_salina.1